MLSYWFKLLFNWSFVRAFGELHILTRISFTMLVFVPVLAALWPVIAEMLRYLELLFSNNGNIQPIKSGTVAPKNIRLLPSVWAIAFAGSLATVSAHLVYQVWAPAVIKNYSGDQFLDAQIKRYNENPTKSQLRRAIHIIKMLSRKEETEFASDYRKLLQRWEKTFLTDELKVDNEVMRDNDTSSAPFEPVPTEMDERQKKIAREFIHVAAKEEYRKVAGDNSRYACLASLLYLIALMTIVWITASQAVKVFSQAGFPPF